MSGTHDIDVLLYTDVHVRGGVDAATGYLLESLRPDLTVAVIGTNLDVLESVVSKRPGVERFLLPPIRNWRDLGAMLAHRRVFARLRPRVLHVALPSMGAGQWALLAASTIRGISLLAVEHAAFPPVSRAGVALKRLVEHRIGSHVAVSHYVAREVERVVALPSGSLTVIHNGVPDFTLPPRSTSEQPVIGTIARLAPTKGVDVLVRAMVGVPDARLVIVGTGPEEPVIRDLARQCGVASRIEWVGWTDQPRTYLATFDVFALASRAEGLSLAICEAMLARLPVVATSVGGIPEIVADGETGLLVPLDDPEKLARALYRLTHDPSLRQRMGEAGRQRARDSFSPESMARAYEALYDGDRKAEFRIR